MADARIRAQRIERLRWALLERRRHSWRRAEIEARSLLGDSKRVVMPMWRSKATSRAALELGEGGIEITWPIFDDDEEAATVDGQTAASFARAMRYHEDVCRRSMVTSHALEEVIRAAVIAAWNDAGGPKAWIGKQIHTHVNGRHYWSAIASVSWDRIDVVRLAWPETTIEVEL